MNIKRISKISVLTSVSLILYIVEAQLPALTAVPGIKLGLSNAVTLVAVSLLGRRDAGAVLLVRIILSSIFTGNMTSFIYSLCGAVCCYAVVCLTYYTFRDKQLWAVSILGAAAHNAGQLAAACFMLHDTRILWYSPALLLGAILAGTFTGLCAQYTVLRLKKIK